MIALLRDLLECDAPSIELGDHARVQALVEVAERVSLTPVSPAWSLVAPILADLAREVAERRRASLEEAGGASCELTRIIEGLREVSR